MWNGVPSLVFCDPCWKDATRKWINSNEMFAVWMTDKKPIYFTFIIFSIKYFDNWRVTQCYKILKSSLKAECPIAVRLCSASVSVFLKMTVKRLSAAFCGWALSVSSDGWNSFVLIRFLQNLRSSSHATLYLTRRKPPSNIDIWFFRRLYTTL